MIPVEFLWGGLIFVFGVIGLARGLWKELGVTTIVLLSLFAVHVTEKLILERLMPVLQAGFLASAPDGTIRAIYYSVIISFVAFISYQGITLEFPIKKQKGPFKWLFGFVGGLLNGYLIVGTVWDVISQAKYFGLTVPLGAAGNEIAIGDYLTALHTKITTFLPVTLMNSNDIIPYVFLVLGMILLLAIILK